MRQVSHRGRVRELTLNPVWVRLDRIVHEEFGIERLFLVSRGRRLPIAAFLGPHEKESFALALVERAGRGQARADPDGESGTGSNRVEPVDSRNLRRNRVVWPLAAA